jgi:hypothetical protein
LSVQFSVDIITRTSHYESFTVVVRVIILRLDSSVQFRPFWLFWEYKGTTS